MGGGRLVSVVGLFGGALVEATGFILVVEDLGWFRRTLRLVGMNLVTSAVIFRSCGCAEITVALLESSIGALSSINGGWK